MSRNPVNLLNGISEDECATIFCDTDGKTVCRAAIALCTPCHVCTNNAYRSTGYIPAGEADEYGFIENQYGNI
jgi:hypothetical protein